MIPIAELVVTNYSASWAKPISVAAHETARHAPESAFVVHAPVLYLDVHTKQWRKGSFLRCTSCYMYGSSCTFDFDCNKKEAQG